MDHLILINQIISIEFTPYTHYAGCKHVVLHGYHAERVLQQYMWDDYNWLLYCYITYCRSNCQTSNPHHRGIELLCLAKVLWTVPDKELGNSCLKGCNQWPAHSLYTLIKLFHCYWSFCYRGGASEVNLTFFLPNTIKSILKTSHIVMIFYRVC